MARPFLAVGPRGDGPHRSQARMVRRGGMAKSAKATQAKEKEEVPEKEEGASDTPLPLLDLNDAGVKKMIKAAKKRGYVTIDQINQVMPSGEVSSDQIEDIYAMLNEIGINVVETEDTDNEAEDKDEAADDDDEDTGSEVVEAKSKSLATTEKKEPSERTDDPVRMYLREMGSVELLSREGEIAIAKRIEAGREAMIAGLCESPLTFQAVIIWRDELKDAKILLRDIIDLEATYEGPEAKAAPPPVMPQAAAPVEVAPPPPPAQAAGNGADGAEGEPRPEGELEDDEDFENALSLAAMEAELKPKVLETFDNIAGTYKKLRKLQDKKVEMQVASEQFNRQQQRGYDKLRDEIIGYVKSLSLNNARIESLVEQLYTINKRLVALESRLMRLADSYGVPRQNFIDEYFGNELDQAWIERMGNAGNRKWVQFIKHEKGHIDGIRDEIRTLASETGLEI